MLTEITGYRKQPVKHHQPLHNLNNDLMNVPNIIRWVHENTTGIVDDNVQLLRPVAVVGLPTASVSYICTRHSAQDSKQVVTPTDCTDYETRCAAVIALGPLDRAWDVWLGTTCHRNTGDYRNWAFIHATPIDSITCITDYDIYASCMRYARRYIDILAEASNRRFDLVNLLPGRHCASIFNNGIADWSACGLYYDNDTHKRMLIIRLVVY